MVGVNIVIVATALILTISLTGNEALTCLNCAAYQCRNNVLSCQHGTASDICGCCTVCAKGPGEPCGGIWNHGGTCGINLKCRSDPTNWQKPGVCINSNEEPAILPAEY